jgi:hypothetical protein
MRADYQTKDEVLCGLFLDGQKQLGKLTQTDDVCVLMLGSPKFTLKVGKVFGIWFIGKKSHQFQSVTFTKLTLTFRIEASE